MLNQAGITTMLSAQTATGYSQVYQPRDVYKTFQAFGSTSAGSGAATIIIQVSDVPDANLVTATDIHWITAGTITLTLGTTVTTDGFAVQAKWRHVRAKVSAISGTDASVNVYMGG